MERRNKGRLGRRLLAVVILVGLIAGGVHLVKLATSPKSPTPAVQKPEQPVVASTPPAEATQPAAAENVELPKTGPAETVGLVIALGILALAGVSYVRSRRPELSL